MRQARITLPTRRDAVIMVAAGQTGYTVLFRIYAHTAEFQDAKLFAILGQANLLIKHRTVIGCFDGNRGDKKNRAENDQRNSRNHNVQQTLMNKYSGCGW